MIAVIFFLLILNLGISNAQNCSQLFNKEMLRLHNLDRGKHKAPALSLDISLTNFATSYTSKLASRNGGLVHSQARGQGENLAALFGNANPDKCTEMAKQMYIMWYNEKDQYNFSNGQFSMNTGHFTQVVWISTKKLGCGISLNGNRAYGTCSYIPPGNFQGEFNANVKPI